MCWEHSKTVALGVLLVTFAMTSCGQKGPLYLPEKESKQEPSTTETQKRTDKAPERVRY